MRTSKDNLPYLHDIINAIDAILIYVQDAPVEDIKDLKDSVENVLSELQQ